MIARVIDPPSKEIIALKKTFCDLPGSTISKLKELHSEVFLKVNLGRLLVFLKFAEDLELRQEEWGQLYAVIYPTFLLFIPLPTISAFDELMVLSIHAPLVS